MVCVSGGGGSKGGNYNHHRRHQHQRPPSTAGSTHLTSTSTTKQIAAFRPVITAFSSSKRYVEEGNKSQTEIKAKQSKREGSFGSLGLHTRSLLCQIGKCQLGIKCSSSNSNNNHRLSKQAPNWSLLEGK